MCGLTTFLKEVILSLIIVEGTRDLISEDSIDFGRWSFIGKSNDFVEHIHYLGRSIRIDRMDGFRFQFWFECVNDFLCGIAKNPCDRI